MAVFQGQIITLFLTGRHQLFCIQIVLYPGSVGIVHDCVLTIQR